jgi:hypothetical protein
MRRKAGVRKLFIGKIQHLGGSINPAAIKSEAEQFSHQLPGSTATIQGQRLFGKGKMGQDPGKIIAVIKPGIEPIVVPGNDVVIHKTPLNKKNVTFFSKNSLFIQERICYNKMYTQNVGEI